MKSTHKIHPTRLFGPTRLIVGRVECFANQVGWKMRMSRVPNKRVGWKIS